MITTSVRLARLALAASTLVVLGCASPPEAEQKAAREAVDAATSAGAERYAQAEWTAMMATFRKAESEMSAKAYTDARVSYASVRTLADTAVRAAESGKAAMKGDLEKQLSELVRRWEDLQGQTQAAAMRMRGVQKEISDADARTVVERLEAARAAVAGNLTVLKEKIADVGAALDKWEADLGDRGASAVRSRGQGKP